MDFEIRELYGEDDFDELLLLQKKVGGLPPRDVMSPITLSALTMKKPRVGWVLGAFHEGKMVGFIIGFASATPGLVFGHMLGVLNRYRDSGLGRLLLIDSFERYKECGMDRVCWTFEPLESRNAHIYVGKLGGKLVNYLTAHYHLDSGIHHGMPQDRVLVEVDLHQYQNVAQDSMSCSEALGCYPLASCNEMPSSEVVLVEIPGDLRGLQAQDASAALKWRVDTRAIFEEYINQRGMIGVRFFSGLDGDRRRSFYLLRRV